MATTANKFRAARADEICRLFKLGEPARALLAPDMAPLPFAESLIQADARQDATRLIAHGLPKREAVWWACLCVREAGVPDEALITKAALAAERWVFKQSEETRLDAGRAADEAGTDHPAGWAARAAFWSGGSLAPPEAPPVPPGDNLTGEAVTAAISLAAVSEPLLIVERYGKFFAAGLEIAQGGNGRKALPDVIVPGQQ